MIISWYTNKTLSAASQNKTNPKKQAPLLTGWHPSVYAPQVNWSRSKINAFQTTDPYHTIDTKQLTLKGLLYADDWHPAIEQPMRCWALCGKTNQARSGYPYWTMDAKQMIVAQKITPDRQYWRPSVDAPQRAWTEKSDWYYHTYPYWTMDAKQLTVKGQLYVDRRPYLEAPQRAWAEHADWYYHTYPCWWMDSKQLTIKGKVYADWKPCVDAPQKNWAEHSDWYYHTYPYWTIDLKQFATKERVSIDRFHPNIEQPIANWARSSVLAKTGTAAWPYLVKNMLRLATEDIPTADRWEPATNQPRMQPRDWRWIYPWTGAQDAAAMLQSGIDPPDRHWWRPCLETPDRTWALKKIIQHLFPTYSGRTDAPEIITADKWIGTYSPVPLWLRVQTWIYPTQWPDMSESAIITADQWHPAVEQPRQQGRDFRFDFPTLVTEVEFPEQLLWHPVTEQPLNRIKGIGPLPTSLDVWPQLISTLGWQSLPASPWRPKWATQQVYGDLFEQAEVILPEQWTYQTEMPQFPRMSVQILAADLFEEIQEASLSWLLGIEVPQQRLRQVLAGVGVSPEQAERAVSIAALTGLAQVPVILKDFRHLINLFALPEAVEQIAGMEWYPGSNNPLQQPEHLEYTFLSWCSSTLFKFVSVLGHSTLTGEFGTKGNVAGKLLETESVEGSYGTARRIFGKRRPGGSLGGKWDTDEEIDGKVN